MVVSITRVQLIRLTSDKVAHNFIMKILNEGGFFGDLDVEGMK
jgi:hypothetical protein